MSSDTTRDRESAPRRGVRVGDAAAALGFDWETAIDALDKVDEEVEELRDALREDDEQAVVEELGDLLFAVCNVARKVGVDPERSLHEAIDKFERRFQRVRRAVDRSGRAMQDVTLDELERIWQTVK